MIKKIFVILLALLCVLWSSVAGVVATSAIRTRNSLRFLSPLFLLYSPMEHELNYDYMLGYLSFEGEDIILYFGRDDWLCGNRENGVLIVPPGGQNRQQWKDEMFTDSEFAIFSWFLLLEGRVILTAKANAKGCIAQYEATKCWSVRDAIIFQPRSQETVVEYPHVPDGWDTNLDNGDGSSEDQALPVSMYRYVVRGKEYYGKWITVTGRMIGILQLIWICAEISLPLHFLSCTEETNFQGSLLLGEDEKGWGVYNDQDYRYGMVVTLYGHIGMEDSGELEQFGQMRETRIQKVPKRGETRE